MNMNDAALFFGISKARIQPRVFRVSCRLCGVTGREHSPRIAGGNSDSAGIAKAIREHAREHIEKAIEEHRDRLLAEVERRVNRNIAREVPSARA